MSEPESTPPEAVESPSSLGKPAPRRRRRLLRTAASGIALLAVVLLALYLWASSSAFERLLRKEIIARLQAATGGRVEIAAFHWNPLNLEADAEGFVLHGLEAPDETPLVRIDHLHLRLTLLGFLSPSVRLNDLEIDRPKLHLIVYRDGSTNEPKPPHPGKSGRPVLDTFFNLEAGHMAVDQGLLHYENRAAAFDFQNRFLPLNLDAKDLSVQVSFVPAAAGNPESYHIESGGRDLSLIREAHPQPIPQVKGYFQASLDLTRNAAFLRTLRITASGHGIKDRTLDLSGSLNDFTHPHWQAKAVGELDMRLLDPVTGYNFAPEGIARLDISGAGQAGIFRADGSVHVDNGSYIGTGVEATGILFDAHVHADAEQLLITSIIARLRQGGQLEGEVALDHWLPPIPGATALRPTSGNHNGKARPAPPVSLADIITIPVNGKVTARVRDVALDTILDMVALPPFQRLGLDARLNGPANAVWKNGDYLSVVSDALLTLTAPEKVAAGKVATSVAGDGDKQLLIGAVDLRKLELHLPASSLLAHGHLGAYPLASQTAVAVDFQTGDLSEFDTVLRDLGMTRNGISGTAALPISLAGQANFHGTWAGSLADPHLAGVTKATQLTLEIPSLSSENPAHSPPAKPQFVHWDTVDATGSYSAERIDINHALLRQGAASLNLDGSLVAVTTKPDPVFDSNALLHLHLRGTKVGVDQILPFTGQKLPITGKLDAQIDADGPLHTLGGSGWLELDGANVYGEAVARILVQGNLTGETVKLTSIAASNEAGSLSATGNYDLKSHVFQLDAKSNGIDIAQIHALTNQGYAATGKLGLTVTGTGTFEDPRLEAHANLTNLTVGGEPMGRLELTAHTANHLATYQMTTRLDTAELTLHGQTALGGDHTTQVKLDFARFNIGSLLKMTHLQGLGGDSALAGTITVEGPLAHPEEMRGEARLQELAVNLSGVHLHSEGEVHATLANSRLNLDPLHVTGEDTDLRVQGSLSLKDKHQLDLAASGSINLKIAQTLDSDLTASGASTFQVEAHGPLLNPNLRGHIDFQNGSLALEDLPNGLSQIHGTLVFNQNRLDVQSLTAMSGGGLLSVGGYLSYQHGIYADLSVTGKGIRIRYPQGISSQADATFHLQGPQNNLLLGGEVLITRFTVSPDFDIAGLAAQANSVQTIAPFDAPSNHIRLDVHLASSPQLNFQNAYAKLAGDVDLHLRGTVAAPSLLGRVSITEGSALIAGTRYDLQRGDITFTNPVRIQPSIDLNASARVEDYDITLGLHGTPEKLAVTYRSDPPLPEADVVALLALGRTQNQQRLYTQQQMQSGANPTTDALLGGALNAAVSSRVQKLFGAGSVKVDPNYTGALGNSTSRIIVEEQIGRNLTLTYATNVNSTGQQLLQADVAINRHVSLVMARDESGVFSMVLKLTRHYR